MTAWDQLGDATDDVVVYVNNNGGSIVVGLY